MHSEIIVSAYIKLQDLRVGGKLLRELGSYLVSIGKEHQVYIQIAGDLPKTRSI